MRLIITLVLVLYSESFHFHHFNQNPSRLTSLHGTDYRLWDEERGFPLPGFIGTQTAFVLNLVADLLRIQGDGSEFIPEINKSLLIEALKPSDIGRNGLDATAAQKAEISGLVEVLEAKGNPTLNPALATNKLKGNWQMLYTDLTPAAPSSGKLGPFLTGDVYQEVDPENGQIKNILFIELFGGAAKIKGGLVAKQSVYDKETWRIDFQYVTTTVEIFGVPIGFPGRRTFVVGQETRLWRMTYLDDNLRILRAKRLKRGNKDEGKEEKQGFIFVLKRVEGLPLDASKI